MYKELEDLQQAFLDRLVDSNSKGIDAYLAGVYKNRFKIYENSYIIRLLNCLCDSYPATFALVGEDVFKSTAFDYISCHPSTSPSINMISMDFVNYIESVFGRGYIFELAQLELNIYKSIHFPSGIYVTRDKLLSIAPNDWPELTFLLLENASFSKFRFDVVRTWEENLVSLNCDISKLDIPYCFIFWRSEAKLKYKKISEFDFELLSLIREEKKFAEVCEYMAVNFKGDELQSNLLNSIASFVDIGSLTIK